MGTPRETLITNFSDGKSPTGSQFKSLIDSIVSRDDDGMDKSADSALKISAGKEAHAPVIALCPKDVLDPQWVLSLKAAGKEGLNIGQGNTPASPVVFLDKTTGNVGLGTNVPSGKVHVVTTSSDGDVTTWGNGQFVVGQEAASGNNSGGLGLSYSTATNTGFISSLSPSKEWRDLGLRGKSILFYTSGSAESMRLTPDGKLGIGTTTPFLQLAVRKDVNDGIGSIITNINGEPNAYVISYLQTNTSNGVIFKNSSTRVNDGGPNTMTVRNDKGDLRLQAETGANGLTVKAVTGYVGIGVSALAGLSIGVADGKKDNPDKAMHISNDTILFGGINDGREANSAQISVARHQANSLCIIGMSDAAKNNRRIDIWAEGGMFLRGSKLAIGTDTSALAPISIYSSVGKKSVPDGGMHISNDCIVFGGENAAGREGSAGQISAGRHVANSLCIVGMTSGPTAVDRKIDLWAEGGLTQRGPILSNSGINNSTARPAVTNSRIFGEIASYSVDGLPSDDGFLRLSAGGGTNASVKSFIDLSGYSTLPEMYSNLVMGTAGAERMRITADGKVGIGTDAPAARLHVASTGKVVDGQGLLLGKLNDQIKTAAAAGEVLGAIDIGFAGWRDNEPNQVGAKISAIRISNFGTANLGHLVQATELAFFTGGGVGTVTNALHETCAERLRINKDGNVGIATAKPASRLSVNGNITIGAGLAESTAAPTNGLLVEGDATTQGFLVAQKGFKIGQWDAGAVSSLELLPGDASPIGNRLIFGTDNTGWKFTIAKRTKGTKAITDLATFTDNGNVGIGTVWPGAKLHVITAPSSGDVGAWDGGQFVVGREAWSGADSGGVAIGYSNALNAGFISSLSPATAWRDLTFRANMFTFNFGGSELMRISNNGCVGIGTKSPIAGLSIGLAGGKEEGPDASMHITNDCILFGGNNSGREANSCQISAGKHQGNSLNIVGMSDAGNTNRRVDIWAEGGLNLNGQMFVRGRNYRPNINDYHFLNQNSVGHSWGTDYVSIWTDERVVAREFNAVSDARTKVDVTISDGLRDLDQLRQIEICNYNYKDVQRSGTTMRKGVIAQQLYEIYPEAVNVHSEVVPDIFDIPKKALIKDGILTVTMNKAHGLKSGETVRIISKNGHDEIVVKVKNNTTFIVEDWKHGDEELFIYGKKVDDFMVVDYQRIFAMGLSATQELSRQVETLKAQNESLLQEFAELKKQLKMEN